MLRTVSAALLIAFRMASSTLVWLLPTISLSRYTWSLAVTSWSSAAGVAAVRPEPGTDDTGQEREPTRGLEPRTARLQVECATNCATPADVRDTSRTQDRDSSRDVVR